MISFGVVVIALLVAILVVLLRDDDPETADGSSATTAPAEVIPGSGQTATTAGAVTPGSGQTATTAGPGQEEIPSAPPCTSEALLAGQNLNAAFVVDDYGCTPTSLTSVPAAYAWARMSDPSGSTVVYYSDTVDGNPQGRWEMVGYATLSAGSNGGEGSSCEAFLPAAACSAMPGVPT
jgi:hypothetical protein